MKNFIMIYFIAQIVFFNLWSSMNKKDEKSVTEMISVINIPDQKFDSIPHLSKKITFKCDGKLKTAGFIIEKCVNPNHKEIIESSLSQNANQSDETAYLIFDTVYVAAGPGMDEFHALMYTKSGKLLCDIKIGEKYIIDGPDRVEIDCKYAYIPINHALEVIKQNIAWDEKEQMETKNETFSYYHVDASCGIINVTFRKYQIASDKILNIEDLSPYSKEELKIMRNEIFASYGYIFKTEALKNYFSKMIWYFPTFANVDHMLSHIEKENVKLIKKVEDGL